MAEASTARHPETSLDKHYTGPAGCRLRFVWDCSCEQLLLCLWQVQLGWQRACAPASLVVALSPPARKRGALQASPAQLLCALHLEVVVPTSDHLPSAALPHFRCRLPRLLVHLPSTIDLADESASHAVLNDAPGLRLRNELAGSLGLIL